MSVPHSSRSFSSARNVTIRMPWRDTTPEYVESTGALHGAMTSGDESTLVATVMFDVVDHVAWDLLVAIWNRCSNPERFKCLIVDYLILLKQLRLLPLVVAVLFIDAHGLIMISRDLVTILITRSVAITFEANLIDRPANGLRVTHIPFTAAPSWLM